MFFLPLIKMRFKTLFCAVILSILNFSCAQSPCKIEGLSYPYGYYTNPQAINDSYIGTVQIFNDTNIEDAYVDDVKYINVSVEDNVLIIATTLNFEFYEEDEEDSKVVVNINLICADGNDTFEYRLNIEDENNHEPEFDKEHYYYTVYDKFPGSLDISLTDLQPIIARDIDIKNSRVDFNIEDNKIFTISYFKKSSNLKEHIAKLYNSEDISAPFNETYKLTVTDSGTPSRSSNSYLTVQVISTGDPIFTESLYVAYVTEDLKVVVKNGPIALINDLQNVTITLPSEYSDYFQINGEEIQLLDTNVNSLLNESDYVILTLLAESSNSETIGEASLVIDVSALFDTAESTTNQISTEDTIISETSEEFTTEQISETTESTTNQSSTEDSAISETSEEVTTEQISEGTTETTVRVVLRGFNSWISFSTTFNVIVVVLAGISIVSAIFYLRFKLYK